MTTIKFNGNGRAQVTIGGKPYICNPTTDIPDEFVENLTRDKQFIENFTVVGPAKASPAVVSLDSGLPCPTCGKVCGSKAGLAAHQRKHKDNT